MRFLTTRVLVLVCSGICINTLCVNAADADSVTFVYRGNYLTEIEGDPEVFSTKDRVIGRFTIDCSAAHFAGTCADLPYDNYLAIGAVELEPLSFSAGPASLPTADGDVDINAFSFSTDSNGQIVDWDIDLTFPDPSGLINVDTDNAIGHPIDSAAALGGGAVVVDNPGNWKGIRHSSGHSPITVISLFDRFRMISSGPVLPEPVIRESTSVEIVLGENDVAILTSRPDWERGVPNVDDFITINGEYVQGGTPITIAVQSATGYQFDNYACLLDAGVSVWRCNFPRPHRHPIDVSDFIPNGRSTVVVDIWDYGGGYGHGQLYLIIVPRPEYFGGSN